ncbi:MAG TPA: CHAT domain-containing tetratricopeptide repeat protein [Ktedonobacteraceae bacterium]|nr:CHAT domain-containing tetratricopeptide repeat protein [Ktedonobacteraceae bacterium]
MNEEQGRQLLQSHTPLFNDAALERLVYLLKKEADHQWTHEGQRSLVFSGYLLLVSEITQNKYYYALGLMTRGDALRRMDRDRDALPFFDAAGEEFIALGDEIGWARTRVGRVSACLRLNRTTEALRDAATAREIFVRHGKWKRAGQIDVNAALINFELGQYDQALRLFDRAIETYLLQGEGVELNIARARGNKALTLAAQGRFREAVSLHEQARATFAAYGEREEISVAREELNIADIYAAQGHYSQALLLYNRSHALFQKHEVEASAAEVAQQMCLCLVRLNRARDAYELAAETIKSFRNTPGQRHNLARSLMHQAAAAILMDNFREADAMLQEASILLEEGGLMRLAALARLRRAELYFADEQIEASEREARYVADVFADQEDLPNLARTMLLQARISEAKHDIGTAQELCDNALDIAQGQELLELKYLCYDLLGQLAEQREDLAAATSYYDRAIRGIDEIQGRLVLDERTSFLEDKGSIYQRAMLLALKRGNKDHALIYVEKAKSRVLGDYLRNNIDIRLHADDPTGESMLEDLARLREEQAWYSSIVYNTQNEDNLSDTAIMRIRTVGPVQARQEMQKRERRIEQLLDKMQLHAAGDLVSRPRADWTNSLITTLWPRLARNTLMLEYYLTDQDIYIFQLTWRGVNVHHIQGAAPKLERLLSLWRTNLDLAAQAAAAPDRAQAFVGLQENCLGLLQRLYDLLLRPASDALMNCEHLIIVPYGMLHYLPFHCLFDGSRFVVERMDVSYLPSAALMHICRRRGLRIHARGIQLQDSLVLGLSDGGRLTYALQEAQTVANQLGTYPALDDAATASILWTKGAYSPIVHIAAHGLFRLDAPNFSYIKLADRQLSTIEVFNLDLSACSLVVLSACETGRAVVGGVDEVIGLGRGFLYAGAASLLPTLWKIDDASSAELMEMFYQALLNGCGKATALAGAQRAFLAYARTSTRSYRVHPYFWAAFQLIGDAGTL